MGDEVQAAQIAATIAAPLLVAVLCLYARHRRISGDDLLLWAVAHVCLAMTFLLADLAPERGDPGDLPAAWLTAIFFYSAASWLLLFGVLAETSPRVTALRSLIATGAIGMTVTGVAAIDAHLYLHAGLLINPAVNLAAAAILVLRRRSLVYLFAGLVLGLRAGNGFLYVFGVQEAGVFMMPAYTAPLSNFFNFLTGISLLAIAVENAWVRLEQALAEARDARQEADAVLDLAPVSIVRKDANLRLVKVNRYFRDMAHRLGRGSVRASDSEFEEILPDAAIAQMRTLDHEVLSKPDSAKAEREIAFGLDDGSRMAMLVRKAGILNGHGEVSGIISVALDITQLKEVERELRNQIAIAERASKAKSDFLAHMSHELRTPLNGINGYAEMLTAEYMGPLNLKQKEYLKHILDSSRAMLSLVSRILQLSDLDAGRMVLSRTPLDLVTVMRDAMDAISSFAASRDVALELTGDDVMAEVDREALGQVFSNLLANAVKFSPAGSKVRIGVCQEEGKALVEIRDTGAGMTPAQIAAIGDLFLRGDPMKARAGGGSGLGLAISHALVALHGGTIGIISEPGMGTTVTIRL
jgi:PAS domain S-box-containing protein